MTGSGALRDDEPIRAILCTLGMSVIPASASAWSTMLALLAPGGRAALMDGSPPATATTATRLVAPLVWLGCQWFGADWSRSPWRLVQRDLGEIQVTWANWGYLSAASGTKPMN